MLYLMVTLKIKSGRIHEYLAYQQANLPRFLEQNGVKLVGSWVTTIGEANEVIAIHAYRDFEHIQTVANLQAQSQEIQKTYKATSELVENITSKIITPTPYSPIK